MPDDQHDVATFSSSEDEAKHGYEAPIFDGGEALWSKVAKQHKFAIEKPGCTILKEDVNERDIIVSEPMNFQQGVKNCGHNAFEVLQLCLTFLFASVYPNYVSLGSVIYFHLPLLASTMEKGKRLVMGVTFQIIGISLLAAVDAYKLMQENKYSFSTHGDFRAKKLWLQSYGFQFQDQISNDTTTLASVPDSDFTAKPSGLNILLNNETKLEIEIDWTSSFHFEIVIAIIMLVYLWQIQKWLSKLRSFSNKKVITSPYQDEPITAGELLRTRMLLVKTHELKQIYTKYDSDNEQQARGGYTKESRKTAKQNAKHRNTYAQFIERIGLSVPRLYFDSFSWQNWASIFFFCVIIFQLLQAMAFNGLIDIPALFLILGLAASFAYRQQYQSSYQHFVAFFIYFECLVISIKVLHQVAVHVPAYSALLRDALRQNSSSFDVRLGTALFGVSLERVDETFTREEWRVKAGYDLAIAGLLFSLHAYRAARWATIRASTALFEEQGKSVDSYTRWLFYVEHKDAIVTRQARQQIFSREYFKEKQRQQGKRNSSLTAGSFKSVVSHIESNIIKSKIETGVQRSFLSDLKGGATKYQPTIVLWLLRVLVGIQAYMYHSSLGLLHLGWVLFTFAVRERVVYFVTITLMLPVYGWEFTVQYGMRTPVLKEYAAFQDHANYFVQDLSSPVLEQALTFIILALLSTSVSSFKMSYTHNQDSLLVGLFKERIADRKASIFWRFLYLGLKHLQVLVLVALYVNGSGNLNSARNLGFMVFFTVYTASEKLYRRTNVLLIIFISFFIFGQYYFSLTIYRYIDNAKMMRRLQWMNMYENKKQLEEWSEEKTVYFRHKPYMLDYFVLLLMAALNLVNQLYNDKKDSKALRAQARAAVRDRFLRSWLAISSIWNVVRQILVYVALIGIGFMMSLMTTSAISWVFFIVSVALLGSIAKSDEKTSTLRLITTLTTTLKYVSVVVLLIEIFFAVTIGQHPGSTLDSSEEWLNENFPVFYWNLEFIGLRLQRTHSQRLKGEQITQKQLDKYFNTKFLCYVGFLVVSLFLEWHYTNVHQQVRAEGRFNEQEWTKRFEYQPKKDAGQALLQMREDQEDEDHIDEQEENRFDEDLDITGIKHDADAGNQTLNDGVDYIPDTERTGYSGDAVSRQFTLVQGKAVETEKIYTENDLLEHQVSLKFSPAYIAYLWMDWWPFFDIVASYGHLLNSATIVYIAINHSVSFFMLINLFCVATYYGIATTGLAKRSVEAAAESGLQDQVDLHMVRIVTKKYRVGAQFEFLRIRSKLWKVQAAVLVIAAVISFPSTMLARARDKLAMMDPKDSRIAKLDQATFWMFVSGLYKEEGSDNALAFYRPFILIFIALVAERRFINWLQDRNGCTYGRFQKFVELETRIEQIEARKDSKQVPWEKLEPPKYNIQRYANYYYHNDFKKLLSRFTERRMDAVEKARRDKYAGKGFRDFVPYTAAVRIKNAIQISVRIDGRAPEILVDEYRGTKMSLDARTINILDEFDKHDRTLFAAEGNYDLEDIPIFKQHKIVQLEQLLKQAIDRKYKLSFLKGMQLLLESIILLVLMTSVVLKSNFFSLIYSLFIIKFVTAKSKFELLVKLVQYTTVISLIQYTLFLLNLNSNSSPARFPDELKNYPLRSDAKMPYKKEDLTGEYAIPVFFKYEIFQNLPTAYMLGIGIQRSQIQNLTLDFLCLYLVSMYLLTYGNPLLRRSVKKVFWHFPNEYDKSSQWSRLTDNVFKQVKWMQRPLSFSRSKYDIIRNSKEYNIDPELAKKQYKFALEYNKAKRIDDLERTLTNYVDLRFLGLWNDKTCREKKWELKRQSNYFRLVKRGSLFIYLTFHIFTIMVILLMATVRAALISLVYVLILLPNFRTGAEVLTMRLFAQENSRLELEAEVANLEEEVLPELAKRRETLPVRIQEARSKLEGLESQMNKVQSSFQQVDHDEIKTRQAQINAQEKLLKALVTEDQEVREREQLVYKMLQTKRAALAEMADRSGAKSVDERLDERALIKKYGTALTDKLTEQLNKDKFYQGLKGTCCRCCRSKKEPEATSLAARRRVRQERDPRELWGMVRLVNVYLMNFALIDFVAQILWQQPLVEQTTWAAGIGFLRVWRHPPNKQLSGFNQLIANSKQFVSLDVDTHAFGISLLTCFIIATISLQREIFISYGYEKFVTQKNGSMDLLVQLASLKAEAISYIKNNHKVQKIVAIQRHRDTIVKTVDKLRQKLINWRMWTRSALEPGYADKSMEPQDDKSDDDFAPATTSPTKVSFAAVNEVIDLNTSQMSGSPGRRRKIDRKQNSSPQKTAKTSQATARTQTTTKQEQLIMRRKRIPKEEAGPLFDKLAKEFVDVKRTKLNCCAQLYLFLQENFVNQILLIQEKDVLEKVHGDVTRGEQSVPCELERLMLVEADEVIREHYETLDGLAALWQLLSRFKRSDKNLLELTELDKQWKLKNMPNTWAFTRRGNMVVKIFETLFDIFTSQTRSLIYLTMILSIYSTAGLISIFYPLAVFGYAMLEETRPRKEFWRVVIIYTTIILLLKFVINLSDVTLLQSKSYIVAEGYMRLGLKDYVDLHYLVPYMMPEILIVTLIMINEIVLKLSGLHYQIEEDIETLTNGINRNQVRDIAQIKQEAIEKAHMNMSRFFISREQQFELIVEAEEQAEAHRKYEAIRKGEQLHAAEGVAQGALAVAKRAKKKDDYYMLKYPPKNTKTILRMRQLISESGFNTNTQLSEKAQLLQISIGMALESRVKFKMRNIINEEVNAQKDAIKQFASEIWKSSREFEMQLGNKQRDADIAGLQQSTLLRKQLESDNVMFIEGHQKGSVFVDPFEQLQGNDVKSREIKTKIEIANELEAVSAFDYEEEYESKREVFDLKNLQEPSLMERSRYFARLFPTLRIQKPGVDFYGSTTLVLVIIAIYVFMAYDYMTVNPFQLLKGAKESSNLFTTATAVQLVMVLFIIILERYVNRSDTKTRNDHDVDEDDRANDDKKQKNADGTFFEDDEVFKGLDNPNQQTVRLQTWATSNIDTASSSAQKFLAERYGSGWNDGVKGAGERSSITTQQKCKYLMHITLLISVHLQVFWFLPVSGNWVLYGAAYCDSSDKKDYGYGCFNFHDRWQIMVYYTLWVIYFVLSASQLRYGMPIKKVASSVFFVKHDLGAPIASIYMAIPFAVEIRCLLDFTFSKTALDNFQFWQTYSYNVELYIAKWGNNYYTEKRLGSDVDIQDKIIGGWVFCTVLLALLIGPFLFFSDVSGFITTNPAKGAEISLAMVINKTISRAELLENDATVAEWTRERTSPSLNLTALTPNKPKKVDDADLNVRNLASSDRTVFYEVKEPYLRQYTAKELKKTNYSKWAETKFFKAGQVQECLGTEYPDRAWDIDRNRLSVFARDVVKSLDPSNKYYHFGLEVKYKFTRENPPEAKTTKGNETKRLNLTQLDDCITSMQLATMEERLRGCASSQYTKPLLITFSQAFDARLILGSSSKTYPIYRNFVDEADQKFDIRIKFSCPRSWTVHQSLVERVNPLTADAMDVDPFTCNLTAKAQKIVNEKNLTAEIEAVRRAIDPQCEYIACDEADKVPPEKEEERWGRIRLVLFTMMASSSFLAAYSVTTFYIGITYAISGSVRAMFLFGPWMGFIYEITHPDALLRLCDGIYMRRHEEDLVSEEEYYRMLQEIMRSPDLLKALTGSSLKGATDPNIDKMPASVRKKIMHLEALQRKGYDVEQLKTNLLKAHAPEDADDQDE